MAKYDEHGFITELDEGEIFVFGSNGQGAHLGGAGYSPEQIAPHFARHTQNVILPDSFNKSIR